MRQLWQQRGCIPAAGGLGDLVLHPLHELISLSVCLLTPQRSGESGWVGAWQHRPGRKILLEVWASGNESGAGESLPLGLLALRGLHLAGHIYIYLFIF